MNASSERSTALWMAIEPAEGPPPLQRDETAEVAVVGAGIAGLSAAYELTQAGRSVVVLDRGPLTGGMSSRTTAHLASACDDYYHRLIARRGVDDARAYHGSQAAAIERIEAIQREEGIDCDFARLDGYLVGSGAEEDAELLERELQACRDIGFDAVELLAAAPLPALRRPCLRFPAQGRFHPRKYLNGLIAALRRDGARLFANCAVTGVEESGDGVELRVESGARLRCGAAVFATNSPVNDRVAIHTKQAPYRTYVIAGRVARGSVVDALYWDTLDPYHYVRLQPHDGEQDWLVVGGEDHKTGQADDMAERLAALEDWARIHFPGLGAVEYRWSGQVLEPVDYLPFAGRNPGNNAVYVATGDSGQGMTGGVAAAMLIRDLVLGRENPWAAALDPRRVTLSAAASFASENVTMVAGLAERLTPGEATRIEDLEPGRGALIRDGLHKLAAYRADSGRLYVHSASCTHAGCVVHWNPFELCWDCPCHGSHFAIDGEVLNGPAMHGLRKPD